MKLSAVVLLSVNFVAASQMAANAADTASFLQDALTAQPQPTRSTSGGYKASHTPAKQKPRAASPAKKRAYVAMTPVVDGVKIRPFVPGRYLPSEADLEAKKQRELAAQQMFYVPRTESGMLAGQVSSNNNNMGELGSAINTAASYAMSRPANQAYMHKVTQAAIQKVKQAAKNFNAGASQRSVPGMNPVLPGQFAQIPGAPGAIPEIPEPQTARQHSLQVPQPPSARALPQVPQYVAAPTGVVVPPPALTKYESSQLERLVESNLPENVYAGFNGDMRASSQGNPGLAGAGPPPYPLSTLPINAGRRGSMPTVGAQARFGSWHGGNSNLPQASFHSYVPIHTAGPMSVKINHYRGSHKTGRQAVSMHHSHSANHAQHSLPKVKTEKKKADPPIKSYAPYRKYSGLY